MRIGGAEPSPVEARRHSLDGLLDQDRFQLGQHVGKRHHEHAVTLQQADDVLVVVLGPGHAGILPRTPRLTDVAGSPRWRRYWASASWK